MNNTNDGEVVVESGANGLDKLGLIRKWKGEENLNYWNDPYCNMINGRFYSIY